MNGLNLTELYVSTRLVVLCRVYISCVCVMPTLYEATLIQESFVSYWNKTAYCVAFGITVATRDTSLLSPLSQPRSLQPKASEWTVPSMASL